MSSVRSISIVSLSFFIQTVSSIIFYLIVARKLPVQEVGAITLFLSFRAIFMVAFALNLDTGFIHFLFKGQNRKIFTSKVLSGNYCDYHGDQLCNNSIRFAFDCIGFFSFIQLFGRCNSHGRICFSICGTKLHGFYTSGNSVLQAGSGIQHILFGPFIGYSDRDELF